jgi:hypothetical protein
MNGPGERGGRRPVLPERGSAVLVALVLLLPLSLLAALGIYVARADLMIFAHMKRERAVFYAAGEILEDVLAELREPVSSPMPDEAFRPPWDMGTLPLGKGTAGRYGFRWRIDYLEDLRDLDGDPDTPVVLFNGSFGYGESPFELEGYPIFQVEVLAADGAARKSLVTEVTPLPLNPVVEAAWSAGGGLVLEGPVTVSGRDHDLDGLLSADPSGDLPGLLARGPVVLVGGALAAGAPDGVPDAPRRELPGDPLEILNTGGALKALSALPPPPEGGPLQGIFFTGRSYMGPLEGEGVLVVHNPRFLPGPFEASRIFFEEGVLTEEFDPAYSHLDPACQPAVLDIVAGGSFRGLVVADAAAAVADGTTIIGALVTLSRSSRRLRAEAPVQILFSRESLARAGRGPLSLRLGFKALEEPSRRLSGG